MNKVVIQVPIDAKLRDQATAEAKRLGFSSLQEVIRLFLVKLAAGELTFFFQLTSNKTQKA